MAGKLGLNLDSDNLFPIEPVEEQTDTDEMFPIEPVETVEDQIGMTMDECANLFEEEGFAGGSVVVNIRRTGDVVKMAGSVSEKAALWLRRGNLENQDGLKDFVKEFIDQNSKQVFSAEQTLGILKSSLRGDVQEAVLERLVRKLTNKYAILDSGAENLDLLLYYIDNSGATREFSYSNLSAAFEHNVYNANHNEGVFRKWMSSILASFGFSPADELEVNDFYKREGVKPLEFSCWGKRSNPVAILGMFGKLGFIDVVEGGE